MTDFAVDPSPDTAPAAHGILTPHDRPTIPVTPDTPGALTAAQRSLGYIAADWTRRGPYGHWLPPGGVMDYDPRQLFRLDPAFLARYEGKVPGWLPLGRVVFERTYARFLHHLGRPETPPEVFARCCEAVFGVYAHQATVADAHWSADKAQREAQEMFRRMWGCSDDPDDVGTAWAFALPGADGPVARTARVLPAGRQLANLGTVAMLAKGGMCLNNCLTGDTVILTRERGAVPIETLVGETVDVLTRRGWAPAMVSRIPGAQRVQEVVLAPIKAHVRGGTARTRTALRHVVKATENHRWVLLDGSVTTALRVGDNVLACVDGPSREGPRYLDGLAHGVMFGDGTAGYRRKRDGLQEFHVRLCGGKVRYAPLYPRVSYPQSYGGDALCSVHTSVDLKALPTTGNADYLAGFIDGWVGTDGSSTPAGSTVLATANAEAAAWLKVNAPYAGFVCGGHTQDTRDTNFGPRAAPLHLVRLTPRPVGWRVVAVRPIPGACDVFCAMVPGEHAFTLAAGVYTGNCGFVSTEAIGSGPAAFSRPFVFLMDALMLGVGVGFDTEGAGKAVLVAPERRGTFIVEDTREGWVAAVGTLLRAYVGDGALPEVWDVSRIRAKGLPLRTFGGTSSGPGPLLALLSSLEALCDRYAGRAVDSEWIVDTANMIGRCVVAGGVRRSSELSLGRPEDNEFLDLKNPSALQVDTDTQARIRATNPEAVSLDTEIAEAREAQGKHSPLDPVWAVWQDTIDAAEGRVYGVLSADPGWAEAEARINAHPLRTHRWVSNNSVSARVGQDYTDIGARVALNGEPGAVWLDNVNRHGRMVDGDLTTRRGAKGEGMASLRPDKATGTNPCQPAHATVLTPDGIRTFADIDVGSVIWSGKRWTRVVNKVATGVKPVSRYVTRAGVFVGTENHRVVQRGVKVEAREAESIDTAPAPGEAASVESNPITERIPEGEMPVYDITVDAPEHTYWTGGLLVSNCGEQPLESFELCNLVETFPTNHRTTADWHATLKYAYLIGKAVSCVAIHDAETDAIVRRNRRIGISVAGVAEWHERVGMRAMCEAMDHGYRELRRIDALYSGWLAMPESVRLTTVKPGGSIPLVVGVEGGMRFPEAPYYVRTVRLHDTSPLIDRLATAGHRIEPDRYAPNTVVAYFPMRDTRVGRYSRDVSLWEQAGLQAALQRWWSDNMVSATWMFQPHEARDIPAVLGAFDHALKGFSALPYSGHAYAQAPYIPCTETEYHALACKLRPVDFSGLGFSRVDHESAAEKFCTGAVCELPIPGGADTTDAPAA